MFLFRPSAKLAKRMGVRLAEDDEDSTTALGDWYSTGAVIGRRQLVLCVSENSRLSVVLDAAPYATIPDRLHLSLQSVLRAIGIPRELAEREVNAMREYRVAKASNRSVISTMNQYLISLSYREVPDPYELSLFLADTVTFSIPEHFPDHAARRLFGLPPRPRLRVVT